MRRASNAASQLQPCRHHRPGPRKAVEFYTKAFGLYVIMGPTTISHDDSAIGQMCDDVFGEGWGSFRIAHLSTSDGIGVELFEFPQTRPEQLPFEYWRPKVFHFCFQDPDLEGRIKLIEGHGGRSACARSATTSRPEALPDGLLRRSVRQHHRALQPLLRADLFGRRLCLRTAAAVASAW